MSLFDRSDLRMKNGIPFFEIPEIAKLGWVKHGFLTRQGGVSLSPYQTLNLSHHNGDFDTHVAQNKNLVAAAFGFDFDGFVLLHQMHQDRILVFKNPVGSLPSSLEYDAMITHCPDKFLAILTADCLPIFVVDTRKKVIAAIHAGRQGTALHITGNVLKKMKAEFGSSPPDLLVAMGPSIGPCCYEIDEKVFHKEWTPFSTPNGKGKWLTDLRRINVTEMAEEGIKEEQIFSIDLCTRCHNDLFFSYRKEAETGRQLSFIGITERMNRG